MRILILIDCYLPSCKSGPKHIRDLGIEFLRQGHEVTVLTSSDTIPRTLQVSTQDEVRVARVKTGKIKGAGKMFRAIQEVTLSTRFWRAAKPYLIAHPADLIVYYSPTIFFGSLVRRLKLLWSCPAYLILRDIFPQWAVDVGVLRKGLVWRFFRRKEIEQYNAADVIAVQSPGDLEYFAREFPESGYRLEVLPNWVGLEEHDLPHTDYRTRLGLQDKVVFFYGGNLGAAQDVDNLLRLAANMAEHSQLHFLLVGDGSEAPRLKKAIEAQGLCNIQVLPPVDQKEYLSMLSEFDVGLISLDRHLTTHNVPGKLLGYMYWGIPVLASVNPGNDLFAVIADSRAGFCHENGNDQKLAAAALNFATNTDLRACMGKNSRLLLELKFSAPAAAHQILRHLPCADRKRVNALADSIPLMKCVDANS
ncbi:MAG: glycosyltransferase family 4 protein [Terriglobia bacterium]|jgi:glycosyltransferase involved in cell wall biosynthesis